MARKIEVVQFGEYEVAVSDHYVVRYQGENLSNAINELSLVALVAELANRGFTFSFASHEKTDQDGFYVSTFRLSYGGYVLTATRHARLGNKIVVIQRNVVSF